MIAASPFPAMIAGLVMRARRRIAAHFFVHHATSAEEAVAFVPQSPIEERQFARMRSRGIVHEAQAGGYWLDMAAWQAELDARGRWLVALVIILCVAIAGAIMLGYRG